jgi:hypothetical protein
MIHSSLHFVRLWFGVLGVSSVSKIQIYIFVIFLQVEMLSSVVRSLGSAKGVLFRAQQTCFSPPGAVALSALQLQQKCLLHLSPVAM